jgi:hypothetical protein
MHRKGALELLLTSLVLLLLASSLQCSTVFQSDDTSFYASTPGGFDNLYCASPSLPQVPKVQFDLSLCNHTWIVTKRVWSAGKGGYAGGFRCGSHYLRHRTCAHSEGARVECATFLWQQICASGFPPHPGPGTQGEGSGKAPASLRALGGIAKPAATALDLATAHRRSMSLGQVKVLCKHCSKSKRKDHLLNGYCKNQKCQAVAPKPLAPKHITQFFSMAEAHRAVPNAHAPSRQCTITVPLARKLSTTHAS